MSVAVKLDAFEGPLDLLLHLIARAKVDIEDIFVSEITEQFIAYVADMPEMDMEVASDFINMAATLLRIKSRSLLPNSQKDEEEIGEEQNLKLQLQEFSRIRAVVNVFTTMETEAGAHFYKLGEEFTFQRDPLDMSGIDLQSLFSAMQVLLAKRSEQDNRVERVNIVRREPVSIRARIELIQRALRRSGSVKFSELFHKDIEKDEIIATFLALLEIIASGQAGVMQEGQFAEIEIHTVVQDGDTYADDNE